VHIQADDMVQDGFGGIGTGESSSDHDYPDPRQWSNGGHKGPCFPDDLCVALFGAWVDRRKIYGQAGWFIEEFKLAKRPYQPTEWPR